MAINSKRKGKRAELEVANILKAHGYEDAKRTAQYCGNTGDAADVTGLRGFHIEVKYQEQIRLDEWIAQAKRDATFSGDIPIVVHRKNGQPWRVTLDFETFLDIVKDYCPF